MMIMERGETQSDIVIIAVSINTENVICKSLPIIPRNTAIIHGFS
ncbi:hypothetical protein [Clostridium beijerinckii]|nr:hypothetical protein [Clostridium beijerinckii]NRS95712.1 hypothetical protein [Clostridium beijerinckii]NRU28862.1 hypothetical protein [Clostridium beijerinckii]NRU59605.1 hypothetical protein [Clostridium beijerinckii]NRU65375.1 hypothetical protein [Clostridium beijerinckii]NRV32602.1 hypothetical protein [Clostridium beijerinckii]